MAASYNDKFLELLSKLSLPSVLKNELKHALSHSSFYPQGSGKGNHKEVYLGMFAFKGFVATEIYHCISAEGTKLQHILGNVFSIQVLAEIYEQLSLKDLTRANADFNREKHKHIFVFALMGFLYNCGDYYGSIRPFIWKYFLERRVEQFINKKHQDIKSQLFFLHKQKYGFSPRIEETLNEDKLHVCIIHLNKTQQILHSSKSRVYAKKKAILKALKWVIDNNGVDLTEIDNAKKEKQEEERKLLNKEKQEALIIKNELTKQARNAKKENQLLHAQEKDEQRRKMKALRQKKRDIKESYKLTNNLKTKSLTVK